jgi:Guanylate-binding protein, N-terminal domain
VSIIEPVKDSTKLRVSEEGLALLRGMRGRLAPVVVIGPYRSGKSFLINQMLGTGCGAARPASSHVADPGVPKLTAARPRVRGGIPPTITRRPQLARCVQTQA